jgi:molybdopterin molybdotransferase
MELHAFGDLLPIETARRRLYSAARPVSRTDVVRLESAFGRVAAVSVRAPRDVPSFRRATWDGYALRSADTRSARARHPVTLPVIGEVFAEGRFDRKLRTGTTVAIATGAAVPEGADAVVIFEDVERKGDTIRVPYPLHPGERIAPVGDDFPRGTRLVARGETLSAASLGGLAAAGIPTVRVYARPVVAIVPNGNELIAPGKRPRPGAIYESNNTTLAAVVTATGGVPRLYPPSPDDPVRLTATLRSALRSADLVLATGGSSVGERDLLPRVLPKLGTLLFHGLAVRPGKPTLAARCGRKLIVGLPGHPTSCLTNMYWLVLPVLQRLARRPGPGWTDGWAILGTEAVAPTPGLATIVPLAIRDGRAYSTFHGSSSVTSLVGATAFAVLPPGRRRIRKGQRIRVHALDPPLGAILSSAYRQNR